MIDPQTGESFAGLLLRYRGRINLTQRQLAERIGVNMRSVQAWESGVSYPGADHLQALIALFVEAGVFDASRERAQAEGLWLAAQTASSRQRPPFDADWFADLSHQPRQAATPPATRLEDWADAPDASAFIGREPELAGLGARLRTTRCRLLALLGIGGIGKTMLASRVVHDLPGGVERVYWRSLRNAPPPLDWLAGAIAFLSEQAPREAPSELALLALLRQHRCALVLDNFESVLEPGGARVRYRPGYEQYGALVRLVSETDHSSLLVVTSREAPPELAELGGDSAAQTVLNLSGFSVDDAHALLSDKHLFGEPGDWDQLVALYRGNALALKIVGETIHQVFGGDVRDFLEQAGSTLVFGGIRRLLESQVGRLSEVEQQILNWLCIEREPVPFTRLMADLGSGVQRGEALEGLETLLRRSLLERGRQSSTFTLQPVVLEYATEQLVDRAVDEIRQGGPRILSRYALVHAQATDYVRRAQEQLLARPILDRLIGDTGRETTRALLVALVGQLRSLDRVEQGYGPGNVVNLLRLLQDHLRGLNLSNLSIHQAYLQNIEAQDASLRGAHLSDAVLADVFGAVGAVSISANGDRFAAGTLGGLLRVWRRVDRAPVISVRGHVGAVWGVGLSADGALLASGSLDGSLRISHVDSAASVFEGHLDSGGVARVALTDDGRWFLAASLDGVVRVWDVATGTLVRNLEGHAGAAYGLAASADGCLLVTGGADGTVRIWDLERGEQLRMLLGHVGAVWCVAMTASGSLVASSGQDGSIRLWDSGSGAALAELDGHVGAVRGVALSGDGRIVVSGGFDGTVRFWEAPSGRRLGTLQGHAGGVRGVAISTDGRVAVSGGFDGTVRIWDAENGHALTTLQGHSGGVRGVALSNDAQLVASSGPDAMIRVWQTTSGERVSTLDGHPGGVRAIAMNGDGSVLVSCGLDRMVRVWDAGSGASSAVLEGHTAGVLGVALTADGRFVASGGLDGTVRVWDSASHACRAVLEGHSGAVWAVAITPDGATVVSCGLDGTIRLWGTAEQQAGLVLRGHTGGVRSVAVSADGELVASGGDDGSVRVWDTRTGEANVVLEGHAAAVYGVCLSRDSRLLASGSVDATVRLWDVRNGRGVAVFEGHSEAVYAVALAGDGGMVASGGLDGTVRLWDAADPTRGPLRMLRPDRRFERVDISGLTGITDAQRTTLLDLGAVEAADEPRRCQDA